jgi:hypothetical protein
MQSYHQDATPLQRLPLNCNTACNLEALTSTSMILSELNKQKNLILSKSNMMTNRIMIENSRLST